MDSKIYHLLLGRNLNGTDRVSYVPDPDWKPSEKKSIESEFYDIELDFNNMNGNWADMSRDIWLEQTNQKHPMIRVEEEPLIDPIMTKTSDGVDFQIGVQASFVKIEDDMYQYDIHKLSGFVPAAIKDETIRRRFAPFSKHKDFPKIHSTRKMKKNCRLVIITFKTQSHDAMFAKQMMLISSFTLPASEDETPKVYEVRFGHPLAKDYSDPIRSYEKKLPAKKCRWATK